MGPRLGELALVTDMELYTCGPPQTQGEKSRHATAMNTRLAGYYTFVARSR